MDFLEKLNKPEAKNINIGLRVATPAELRKLLGEPRPENDYTGECKPISNPQLKKRIVTKKVAGFSAQGLDVAVESLGVILGQVKTELPELHSVLGTAGMVCARKVKHKDGTLGKNPSTHSWGCAIDIKIGGQLDKQGDNKFFRGLFVLAKFFNAAQWYWGLGFPTEDAMHFEVSFQLLTRWKKEELI